MAIGSINSNRVSTGTTGTGLADSKATAAQAAEEKSTIADHVAAADDQEPIRSGSSAQGTLVDTYL
jgi:hypothetical protein